MEFFLSNSCFIYFFHIVLDVYFFFFFSSRRRHTRSDRDWSSDVCSSDLPMSLVYVVWNSPLNMVHTRSIRTLPNSPYGRIMRIRTSATNGATSFTPPPKIGRASCRERV